MATTTSYDVTHLLGTMFEKGRRPNNFLRITQGIALQEDGPQDTGVRRVNDTTFAMGVDYTLPAPAQPSVLEGADPTPTKITPSQGTNVVQIFQEAVEFTFSAHGRTAAIAGLAQNPAGSGTSFNVDNLAKQLGFHAKVIGQNLNFSALRGVFQSPTDNTTARRTRGVRTAVTTHVQDAAGGALDKADVEALLEAMVGNGALNIGDELFVFGDAVSYNKLISLYEADTQFPESREVAGVGIRTIVTKWATLNAVYEPDLAALELFFYNASVSRIVTMPIPVPGGGAGVLRLDELARTGSADKWQLYGEFGIDYTHEFYHGVIDNFI